MKVLACTLALLAATTLAARAESITITLDQPTQTFAAGSAAAFFGTISNTGTGTIFLNNDDLDFTAAGFTTTDQFFATVPLSLAAGTNSGDIEFFDITALAGTSATALGTYSLFGGSTGDAQDNLGSTGFSVSTLPTTSPVPEPASLLLLLTGTAATLPAATRRLRRQTAA